MDKSTQPVKDPKREVIEQPIPNLTRWELFRLRLLFFRANLVGRFATYVKTTSASTSKAVKRVARKLKWTTETALIFVAGMPPEEKVKSWKRSSTSTGTYRKVTSTRETPAGELSKFKTTTAEMLLRSRSAQRIATKPNPQDVNRNLYF